MKILQFLRSFKCIRKWYGYGSKIDSLSPVLRDIKILFFRSLKLTPQSNSKMEKEDEKEVKIKATNGDIKDDGEATPPQTISEVQGEISDMIQGIIHCVPPLPLILSLSIAHI